jgi:DNA mismatch repair protein MutS
MDQYRRLKKAHPGAILLFRLGDFYEMFYDDARTAAPILEITLTSRQKAPMCGVPFHAVDGYIAKLLKRGFKVAIAEQLEDPKKAKGVVERDVIKVLTPGTAVEVELDVAKESVFIAGLSLAEGGWGLALIDLASGTMRATQGTPGETKLLMDELFRASTKEIVFPEGSEPEIERLTAAVASDPPLRSPLEAWAFDLRQARDLLLEHLHVSTLAGFGLEDRDLAVSAAGALLHYLMKIRKDSLALIQRVSYFNVSQRLILDAATIKNLELVRNLRDGRVQDSLLGVIDATVSALGGRLLKSWLLEPLIDPAAINARLDAVGEWLERTVERRDLRERLAGVLDLERLTGRISLGAAHPRDLVALKRSLEPLPAVEALLGSFSAPLLSEIRSGWDNGRDIRDLVDAAILDEPAFLLTEGGIIRDGFDAELDELRRVSRSGKSFIAGLESRERERTGISSLKVRYNRVFGYSIEVTKPNLHLVPADYSRKQTLVGSERFLTPELSEYETKVLTAEEKSAEIENRLFLEVRSKIAFATARLQGIASAVARLDALAALAEVASRRNYVRPVVDSADRLVIREGRHPVIETAAAEPFIPNDTRLDTEDDQILIITGPNMGGKSTYLRQVALIVILAQMGSFVPASAAELGVVDRVFTRIGAMDFLNVGQSTFMVEMLETANLLNNATTRSLILLDEIGRGTSTFDGLSIAWAVAEHLHEQAESRAKTLFATHYHELTELALTLKRIKNYHVAVKEWKDEVIFLRKILPGPSDQSYGIHVAKLAGLPRTVIDRAREVLFNLEKLELDDAGAPRLAYRPRVRRDKSQLLLFEEEREHERLRTLRDELEACDISALTPLEALNFLNELRDRLRES